MRQNGGKGEREVCVMTEVRAKKNKSSQFSKLNTAELSLRTKTSQGWLERALKGRHRLGLVSSLYV